MMKDRTRRLETLLWICLVLSALAFMAGWWTDREFEKYRERYARLQADYKQQRDRIYTLEHRVLELERKEKGETDAGQALEQR